MNALLTIALVISTVAYIIIGGVIIHKLEWDNQSATRTDISRHLDQTIIQFLCMICFHSFFATRCTWKSWKRIARTISPISK